MKQPNKKLDVYRNGSIHESNRFGRYSIVNYSNANDVEVMFLETGFTRKTSTKSIKLGTVKDLMKPYLCNVGFIGSGEFKSKYNGKESKPYTVWRGMIRRCYDESASGYKYYGAIGVYVCSEWHNFQNFAKWYTENYKDIYKRYELDKDKKSELGNKYYSPETCCLITHKANMQEIKRL